MRDYFRSDGVRTIVCEDGDELTLLGVGVRAQVGEIIIAREYDDAVEFGLSNGVRRTDYTIFKVTLLNIEHPQLLVDAMFAKMRAQLASGEPSKP